jgi:hypothetical protein
MIELTLDEHKILVDVIQDSATVVHKGLSLTDIPLYTKPQWQGLTDAEIEEFENMELGTHDLCLEIEAKLQEKNT